jgi:pyruvate,water dikinase
MWKPIGDGSWVGSDPSERFPVYTRGNAGEVYPEVYRPLTFSIAAESGERAMRNAVAVSGLLRPEELAGIPTSTAVCSGVFGGYAYLNLSAQRLMSARMPGGSAADADATYLGTGVEAPPHRGSPDDRSVRASLAGLRYAAGLLRPTAHRRLASELEADRRSVDGYLAGLPDPARATDAELVAVGSDELIELFAGLFERHLVVSGAAGGTMAMLTSFCERRLGDASLAVRLVSGLGGVDSAAPSSALWALGRTVAARPDLTSLFDAGVAGLLGRIEDDPAAAGFLADFRAFLAEFGSRGPNEWDTAFDTWETDPELALTLVDRMRGADPSHDPDAQRARLRAERDQLEAEATDRLARPFRPLLLRLLEAARVFARSRERSKTTVVRAIHGARLRSHELDRRLVERSGGKRGDLWFVVRGELDDYVSDPAGFAETIAERRRVHSELSRRIPPFVFEGELPPLEDWELRAAAVAPVTAGEVLAGLSGCPGVARGRARVVLDPGDPRGLAPGEVLVAPLTDPSWTPLFVPAEAVVVDVGAVMSHAVIVSRELGIPCAVSISGATRRIPDGALVEVDGGAGTVTVLELP